MKKRWKKRPLVLAVALLMALIPAVALAHWVYDEGYVWENGSGKCLKARSEISDGTNDGGYSKIDSEASREWPYPPIDCWDDWPQTTGNYAVHINLYYWNGSQWVLSDSTDWLYNSSSTHEMTQDQYWNRPSGNGYYATNGGAYIYFNMEWVGDHLWSGSHLLPD